MDRAISVVGAWLLVAVACCFVLPAQAQTWTAVAGQARDVGVGADGSVWTIGSEPEAGGFSIYRLRDNGAARDKVAGSALRIAVDPKGNAWVVNSAQMLFRWDGAKWLAFSNRMATDVGIGADGTVWVIGNEPEAGGYAIHRSADNGASWARVPGSALRIAVDPKGLAWVVNKAGEIFRFDGKSFVHVPGGAQDIGVGADGEVWLTRGGDSIWRWEGDKWVQKSGAARQVAAGRGGVAWVVNAGNGLFRGQDKPLAQTAGGAVAINMPQSNLNIPLDMKLVNPNPQPAPGGTGTQTTTGGSLVVGAGPWLPGTTQAAPSGPTPRTATGIFPRKQGWETQMLKAMRFQAYNNTIFLGGVAPAFGNLPPLDQGFGTLGLAAAEVYFRDDKKITAEQVIAKMGGDAKVRDAIVSMAGMLLAEKVAKDRSNDAATVALRNWAAEVFWTFRLSTAKASLDEYQRWKADPCGYSLRHGIQSNACSRIANTISAPRPPEEIIAKNAMGNAMSTQANAIAAATAAGAAAVGIAGASVAMASALGTVVIAPTVGAFSGVTFGGVTTSLFAAFGGTGGAAAGGAGAIGAVGWAGVVAAPVAAAVMAVVVGVTEGIAVIEAGRVEPMLKAKLGAAMTGPIVIQNALTEPNAGDFFHMAYQNAAANQFVAPKPNVDGEVRFFCQAGYMSRFTLTYTLDGKTVSKTTRDLAVGHEESFPLPARATNIAVVGTYSLGGWKTLFTQQIPKPSFIGFTSYGTIFEPKYKAEYPEIANIVAPPLQLVVTHGGGYVASIRVSYTQGGQEKVAVDDGGATAGWRRTVAIPNDASNIRLYARAATGLAWEPWKTIIDKTYPSPPSECVKLQGTTLDPKSNAECS